jgi:sec-independent protein translocase protein TatC
MKLLPHLQELRRRLVKFGIVTLCFFAFFFYKANTIFALIASPLIKLLPANSPMIATQLTSTVLTPLKLAANCAVLFALPYGLFQLWQFIAPGLYGREKRIFYPLLIGSCLLLFLGMSFCYFIVLPTMFYFFTQATPAGVSLMPDMAHYFDFVCNMMLIFGLCFQLPLIMSLLLKTELVSYHTFKTIRPYVIVGAFIIGMLLTPPDVVSQLMLAVPLCILYELGVLLGKFLTTTRVSLRLTNKS